MEPGPVTADYMNNVLGSFVLAPDSDNGRKTIICCVDYFANEELKQHGEDTISWIRKMDPVVPVLRIPMGTGSLISPADILFVFHALKNMAEKKSPDQISTIETVSEPKFNIVILFGIGFDVIDGDLTFETVQSWYQELTNVLIVCPVAKLYSSHPLYPASMPCAVAVGPGLGAIPARPDFDAGNDKHGIRKMIHIRPGEVILRSSSGDLVTCYSSALAATIWAVEAAIKWQRFPKLSNKEI